jgi:hypothetical protein
MEIDFFSLKEWNKSSVDWKDQIEKKSVVNLKFIFVICNQNSLRFTKSLKIKSITCDRIVGRNRG